MYQLVENPYSKTTGSINIGIRKTKLFNYVQEVRQGCILSLLFNFYTNDLPSSMTTDFSDPLFLPHGIKLAALVYIMLMILFCFRNQNKLGLQHCLNRSIFCEKWMMNISLKKTKIMIRQKIHELRFHFIPFHITNENNFTQEYT